MSEAYAWRREQARPADPLAEVARAHRAALDADADLRDAVDVARENGRTWQEIGDTLGISRQWAWERFR